MALAPIGTGIKKFVKITKMALHDYATGVTENTATGSYADYAVGEYIPAVIQDSIDFSGDEATIETLKDIAGGTISSYESDSATFSIDFLTADLEKDLLIKLTGAEAAEDVTSLTIFGETSAADSQALKISGSIETAVSLISSDGLSVIFIPKAQITTSFSYSDNHVVIAGTITALTYDKGILGDVNVLHAKSSTGIIGSSLTLPSGTYSVDAPIEVKEATTPSSKSSKSTL